MPGRLFQFAMQSTVHIQAPTERVWGVFSDVRRWPEWCGVCLETRPLDTPGWEMGARLGFRLRMAGVGVPFDVAVTECEPPRRLAWASTEFTVTAVRTFTFEPHGEDETIVTDHKHFSSPVLPVRLFYPRWIIRNMTESWLRDLKAECERMARA